METDSRLGRPAERAFSNAWQRPAVSKTISVIAHLRLGDVATQLVDYAKHLYRFSDERIKAAYPLSKELERQSDHELQFANGRYIIGIPGGA